MADAEIAAPPSRRQILLLTAAAVIVAVLIVFAAVLPAEFHRDPTGLGRLTGIGRLWAPEEKLISSSVAASAVAAHSYSTPFRSDVVVIRMTASNSPERGDELEYKVHLKAGGSYIYSWSVDGITDPEEFYTEFHGHTVQAGQPMTVAYYRKAMGTSNNGVLTATFDGVHGWYFQNQSVRPVTVRLRLAGFYDLIPDGKPGNETGLHARQIE